MARTVYERTDVVPMLTEIFRELGYEGTSIGKITARTGLGKGSLYHFFPGGKEEMAAAVLEHVESWFVTNVYQPLETGDPATAIAGMWQASADYFQAGGRVCLVGAFALDDTRDKFAVAIRRYFVRWVEALAGALVRGGRDIEDARHRAIKAVAGIQGALVLARATNDPTTFKRILNDLAADLTA